MKSQKTITLESDTEDLSRKYNMGINKKKTKKGKEIVSEKSTDAAFKGLYIEHK